MREGLVVRSMYHAPTYPQRPRVRFLGGCTGSVNPLCDRSRPWFVSRPFSTVLLVPRERDSPRYSRTPQKDATFFSRVEFG